MRRHTQRLGGARRLALGALLALLAASSVEAAPAASDPAIRADLNGHAIALVDVSRYHCHDRAYPLIRCFQTPAERDTDEQAPVAAVASVAGADAIGDNALISPYVRWYLDANYGGPSFDASVAYRDLGTIGWNDKISSFLTYSGGHPRWWRDVGFTGVGWDWGVGVSVSWVGGSANDQFSSVERL